MNYTLGILQKIGCNLWNNLKQYARKTFAQTGEIKNPEWNIWGISENV